MMALKATNNLHNAELRALKIMGFAECTGNANLLLLTLDLIRDIQEAARGVTIDRESIRELYQVKKDSTDNTCKRP